jgi:aspartate/methionine/tyrosine aminotransferase
MAPMKTANSSLSGLGTTIFEVMSRLAEEHRAVNLGQGFPDEGYPADVLEKAAQETLHGWNQYPSTMGVPELRQAVAEHGGRFYGLEVDWRREVMVTSGATEALAASLLGLIEPGDEVVVFQPMYDCYLPMIRRGGGVPRFVDLRPPRWTFDPDELRAAFSPRTKLVLLNDPLNPAAKVWTVDELSVVADLVREFDAYAVCDEVYEHVVFDGARHVPLMTLPGMRDRCVKIGSAGKTFSLTGWKVGYVTASPAVLGPIAKAHQFLTYTTPPNLQQAVAYGLGKDDAYFSGLASLMTSRRDLLASGLRELGFEVLDCGGTYFLDVDISGLGWEGTDAAFCQWLVKEAGVALIPVSAFYDRDPLTTVVRFCFCKKVSTLEAGLERLAKQFA